MSVFIILVDILTICMSDKTTVLIAGVGGGGHGMELLKAFKMAAHDYKIVATDMWKNSFGLFETPYRYVIPPATAENYLDVLLDICQKEDVQAVVTGSEPELKKVSKNIHRFEDKGIKVLVNQFDIIEKCTDKYFLSKFLNDNGLTSTEFYLYQNEQDLKNLKTFPVIIKPRVGGGSQYVFIAQDVSEADFFCKYLIKYGYEPLIQEYLEDFTEEYTVGVLYADKGKLETSIALKRMLGSGLSTKQSMIFKNKKFVISSGISQGIVEDFTEVRKVAINIAKLLGTNGPINIQCRKQGNEIIPFEINPRFSGTVGPRALVGLNEPDIFCRYRLFGEVPAKQKYNFGYVVRSLQEKYISLDDADRITQYD